MGKPALVRFIFPMRPNQHFFFLAGSPTAVFPAVVDHRKLAVGTNFNDQAHEVLLSWGVDDARSEDVRGQRSKIHRMAWLKGGNHKLFQEHPSLIYLVAQRGGKSQLQDAIARDQGRVWIFIDPTWPFSPVTVYLIHLIIYSNYCNQCQLKFSGNVLNTLKQLTAWGFFFPTCLKCLFNAGPPAKHHWQLTPTTVGDTQVAGKVSQGNHKLFGNPFREEPLHQLTSLSVYHPPSLTFQVIVLSLGFLESGVVFFSRRIGFLQLPVIIEFDLLTIPCGAPVA